MRRPAAASQSLTARARWIWALSRMTWIRRLSGLRRSSLASSVDGGLGVHLQVLDQLAIEGLQAQRALQVHPFPTLASADRELPARLIQPWAGRL